MNFAGDVAYAKHVYIPVITITILAWYRREILKMLVADKCRPLTFRLIDNLDVCI